MFSVGPTTMPCSDAVIGGFLDLVESASIPMSPNSLTTADPIIMEEALAFFSGTKGAQETAANIHTRYRLYLEP